jgi:hypothetical protein
MAGKTTTVTIMGTNLCYAGVWVSVASGSVTVNYPDNSVDPQTETQFTVKPDVSDPTETATVEVAVPDCDPDWGPCFVPVFTTVQIVGCPTPTITSIKPSTWFAGKTYDNVAIVGTNFTTKDKATAGCPETTVNITAADGSVVPVSGVTVADKTKITLTVAPPASDPTETANVTVGRNPNTATATAQILDQKPKITSISPSNIYVGKNDVQVTISGSGFGTSPTVNLPTGVTSSGQTSSDSQIIITLSVGYVTPTTSAKVTVTNNDNSLTSNPVKIILNGPAYGVVQSDIFGILMPGQREARVVQYQVFNIDKTVAANIPLAEDFSATGWNCRVPRKQPTTETTLCDGSTVTEGDGNFPYPDDWTWYEGYAPAGCGVNVTDHWQWCSPSGPTTGITFMTLRGFIHTNATEIDGNIQPPSDGMPKGTIIGP